ncbi:MAG TPA: hypothetical protein PLU24_04560, partial [Candidatus Omnitrophota bacterium]|nr:hypothetical protein [Candidatus Omnitrophota bacterium]
VIRYAVRLFVDRALRYKGVEEAYRDILMLRSVESRGVGKHIVSEVEKAFKEFAGSTSLEDMTYENIALLKQKMDAISACISSSSPIGSRESDIKKIIDRWREQPDARAKAVFVNSNLPLLKEKIWDIYPELRNNEQATAVYIGKMSGITPLIEYLESPRAEIEIREAFKLYFSRLGKNSREELKNLKMLEVLVADRINNMNLPPLTDQINKSIKNLNEDRFGRSRGNLMQAEWPLLREKIWLLYPELNKDEQAAALYVAEKAGIELLTIYLRSPRSVDEIRAALRLHFSRAGKKHQSKLKNARSLEKTVAVAYNTRNYQARIERAVELLFKKAGSMSVNDLRHALETVKRWFDLIYPEFKGNDLELARCIARIGKHKLLSEYLSSERNYIEARLALCIIFRDYAHLFAKIVKDNASLEDAVKNFDHYTCMFQSLWDLINDPKGRTAKSFISRNWSGLFLKVLWIHRELMNNEAATINFFAQFMDLPVINNFVAKVKDPEQLRSGFILLFSKDREIFELQLMEKLNSIFRNEEFADDNVTIKYLIDMYLPDIIFDFGFDIFSYLLGRDGEDSYETIRRLYKESPIGKEKRKAAAKHSMDEENVYDTVLKEELIKNRLDDIGKEMDCDGENIRQIIEGVKEKERKLQYLTANEFIEDELDDNGIFYELFVHYLAFLGVDISDGER